MDPDLDSKLNDLDISPEEACQYEKMASSVFKL